MLPIFLCQGIWSMVKSCAAPTANARVTGIDVSEAKKVPVEEEL